MADSAQSAPVASRVLVEPTGSLKLSSMQLKERLWSLGGPFAGHFKVNHRRVGPGANWVDPGAVRVERRLVGGAGTGRPPLVQWDAGDSISVAGHHPPGTKVLQVEFNCTSEGQRCTKRCGCPVVRCLIPGHSGAVTCACGAGPFFSASSKEQHRAEARDKGQRCCHMSHLNRKELCPVRETYIVYAASPATFVRVNKLSLEHAPHLISPAKPPRRMPQADKDAVHVAGGAACAAVHEVPQCC